MLLFFIVSFLREEGISFSRQPHNQSANLTHTQISNIDLYISLTHTHTKDSTVTRYQTHPHTPKLNLNTGESEAGARNNIRKFTRTPVFGYIYVIVRQIRFSAKMRQVFQDCVEMKSFFFFLNQTLLYVVLNWLLV